MRIIPPEEVHARMVRALRLDPTAVDLETPEAIAAALRRAGGLRCPTGPRSLVRAVTNPLLGLRQADPDDLRAQVEAILEATIAHGDLLEEQVLAPRQDEEVRGLLYLAPPSFVIRESGGAMILGIAPDGAAFLPDELEARLVHDRHVRKLRDASSNLKKELLALGLVERSHRAWVRAPGAEEPSAYLERIDVALSRAERCVELPGLAVLDPSKSVKYYPARWTDRPSFSGRFVGRRRQAYGADLWCYVELSEGRPVRFVDLPLSERGLRGCDEAWRIQLAIDAASGAPQRFRILDVGGGYVRLDLFSPIPRWACRRWDAIGQPIDPHACLISYKLPIAELEEEVQFARDELWLVEFA